MSEAHIRIAVVRLDRAIPFPEANDSVFKGPSRFQGSLTPKFEESKKKNQSRTRSRSAIPTNTNYHPTRPPRTHETADSIAIQGTRYRCSPIRFHVYGQFELRLTIRGPKMLLVFPPTLPKGVWALTLVSESGGSWPSFFFWGRPSGLLGAPRGPVPSQNISQNRRPYPDSDPRH